MIDDFLKMIEIFKKYDLTLKLGSHSYPIAMSKGELYTKYQVYYKNKYLFSISFNDTDLHDNFIFNPAYMYNFNFNNYNSLLIVLEKLFYNIKYELDFTSEELINLTEMILELYTV